jgi:hypothetical protein
MADEVTAEADALAALRDIPWVWQETSAKEDAVAWFNANFMEDVAEQLLAFDGGPDRPMDAFLQSLREAVDDLDPAPEIKAQAVRALDQLAAGWKTAPVLLERARRLIRYAATMAGSGLCRGKEQKEAAAAVQMVSVHLATPPAAPLPVSSSPSGGSHGQAHTDRGATSPRRALARLDALAVRIR